MMRFPTLTRAVIAAALLNGAVVSSEQLLERAFLRPDEMQRTVLSLRAEGLLTCNAQRHAWASSRARYSRS